MLPHFSSMYVNQTIADSGGAGDILFDTILFTGNEGGEIPFGGTGTTAPSNLTELQEYDGTSIDAGAGTWAGANEGSYVLVGDDQYYWDGDSWEAGASPA